MGRLGECDGGGGVCARGLELLLEGRPPKLRPPPECPPPKLPPECPPPPPPPPRDPPPGRAPEMDLLNRLLARLHLGDLDSGDLLTLLLLFLLFREGADEELLIALGLLLIL